MSADLPEEIRVLHVDDEPAFLEVASTSLERADGALSVATETSAAAGLERLAGSERFDCVVSDFDMPGADGLEFLEAVREDYPRLPFILFTGKGSEEIAADAISAGVTDYLQKEVGTDQYAVLANRIENVVRGRRSETVRRRTEERYRTLVEASPLPIAVHDTEGWIVDANESAADFVGADGAADLVGEAMLSFVHPAERDEARRRIQAIVEGEAAGTPLERRIVGVDGEVRHAILTAAPVPVGDSTGGQVVIQDVTGYRERERLLESTGNLLSTLVGNSPVGILAEDADRRVLFPNQQFCDLFDVEGPPGVLVGCECDELAARVKALLVEPERFVETAVEAVEAGDAIDRQQFDLVDGRAVERSGTPVPLEDGAMGYLWVYHDVTERKRAERRFRTLFENLPDPAVTVELREDDALTRSVNSAFERVFGFDAETAEGTSLNELIVPADRDEEAARIDSTARTGQQVVEEVRRRTADGEIRDFLFRNVFLESAGEEPMAHGIYTDITDRKRRERRLDALHEATRRLMATETHDEIAEIASEAAEAILALPLNGIHLYDPSVDALVSAAFSDPAADLLDDVPTFPRGEGIAWRVYESGEAAIYDDVRADDDAFNPETPIRSELLLPLGDHGVFIAGSTRPDDFSETDLALARVLSANVEAALDRADREGALREREAALERQNRRLEAFANVVSHDLRNPLSVADGHLSLARETGEDEHFETVAGAHGRMGRLIDDLLTLARTGREIGRLDPVDLASATRRAWSNVDTGDAELELPDDHAVEADPDRLTQLFENLLRNAVEHGGPAVTVRVGALADGAGFYVEDTGEGIPPGEREEVLESGYTTADDGTGFGLAIVGTIADAHGWGLEVTEGSDGGARIEVHTNPVEE